MTSYSSEFLEEMLKLVKEKVPPWVYTGLAAAARSKAGGRAKAKRVKPNALEKLAISQIEKDCGKLDEDALKDVWKSLNIWYKNAQGKKKDTAIFERAAAHVGKAFVDKGWKCPAGELLGVIEKVLSVESYPVSFQGDEEKVPQIENYATIEKVENSIPIENMLEKGPISLVCSENGVSRIIRKENGSITVNDEPTKLQLKGVPDNSAIQGLVCKSEVLILDVFRWGGESFVGTPYRDRMELLDRELGGGGLSFVDSLSGFKSAIKKNLNAGEHVFVKQANSDSYESLLLQEGAQNAEIRKAMHFSETEGEPGADVMFIGAEPDEIAAALEQPLSPETTSIFKERYGSRLAGANVAISNIYPVRENQEAWDGWIESEIQRIDPGVVVAMGKIAKQRLGHLADEVIPYPTRIPPKDTTEISRKFARIRKRLELEVIRKAEENTPDAQAAWDKDWVKMLPANGSGRFSYQHHWRGLSEKEKDQAENALLDSGHSLHGDLRLSGDNETAFGWTALLGRADVNRRVGGDRLLAMKPDDHLRMEIKEEHPIEWLDKTGLQEPGESGATSKTWAKLFKQDTGTYQIGVVTKNSVEIFLDGKQLKGRYLLSYTPVNAGRLWLLKKPDSQTPRAESDDLADLISNQRQKRRSHVVWSKPEMLPEIYDVRTGEKVAMQKAVVIRKANTEKRIVFGCVVDPYGKNGPEVDAHNEWLPPLTVEKAAHDFSQGPRTIMLQHTTPIKGDVVEEWVEQYPTPADYQKAMRNEDHEVYRRPFGDDYATSGSWWLGVRLGEKGWKAYENGEVTAFSPYAFSMKRSGTTANLPKVKILELVPK